MKNKDVSSEIDRQLEEFGIFNKIMKKYILTLLFSVFSALAFAGERFYVTTTGSDLNDGKSWATAFKDVQKAIDAAAKVATLSSPSQVWIAKGTYYNAGGDIPSSFVMKNNVEIYGNFVGNETSLNERTSGNETILTTTGNYVIYNNYNSSSRLSNTAKLDSVTITGAKFTAIHNQHSSPIIINCIITNNGGTGIQNHISAPCPSIIRDCVITSNGTGINNYAYHFLDIKNCIISSNRTHGIENDASTLNIDSCSISFNTEGISSIDSSPTINNCNITENISDGIYTNGSSSSPLIINCTITKNKRFGIYISTKSTPTIINNTIVNNSEHGIYTNMDVLQYIVKNCIIWGNNSTSIYNLDSRSSPTVTNCIIDGGYSDGENIITEDPLLGELGYYGGNIKTIPVLAESPAIGAGIVDENTPITDARGITRSEIAPTIGAYEYIKYIESISHSGDAYSNGTISLKAFTNVSIGNLTYIWQVYEDEEWHDIENSNSLEISYSNLKQNSKFRVLIKDEKGTILDYSKIYIPTIYESANIVSSPKSIEIYSNKSASLKIDAIGYNLAYQWQKLEGENWVDIDGENTPTLSFESVKVEDEGSYRCVVSNGGAMVISEVATLMVYEPPNIITQPANFEAFVGQSGEFKIEATGYKISYQWYKNDKIIEDATLSTLLIENLELADNDTEYYCVISNEGGSVISQKVRSIIYESANIISQPKSVEIYSGENTRFEVDAIGYNLAYQWQKLEGENWVDIDGENTPTLSFERVKVEDEGSYRCVVSNGGATVISNGATLTLRESANILNISDDIDCFIGADASFEVLAYGYNLTYQWQKKYSANWKDVENATSKSPKLILEDVQKYNSGEYRCVVSNGGGTVYSESVKLWVSEILIETSLPTSLILFENTTHNLEVSASEKDGKKLTYTWYVDKNNGKGFVKAGSKPMLAITPKANMVGWRYYCAVSNESETRNTSVSTIVAVKTPAKITGKPKALEAFEGVGNSGFKVLATGSDLKYQWQVYKVVGYNAKGKPIYDWVDIAGATSANYNPESSLENNGLKYRCKVYNDGSVAYTSGVKYTVREAPKVEGIEVLQCKEKLSFDGSTVVAYEEYPIDLQATAKGYKIKYQWYKNGVAIKGATKSKYTIKKPLESQDSYYCEVYNGDVKDQSSTFVLEVRECPMPASFEGHSLYVSDITDMGDPCRDMRMIFLNKNTLRVTMEDYEVSNPAWSYKRVSPTKAAVSLKFKLYTNDEPVSKLNTISYSYSGEIEFKDNVFRLDLSDKKNGSFSGSFTDADIESADKTSLLSLPISKKITVGEETLMLLDKKNFAMGEVSGTYTYKSNKNGTGVLKLNYKDGSDKYTAEVSMLALSENSGVAVVSTNWNEGKDKFISSDFEEFEIEN